MKEKIKSILSQILNIPVNEIQDDASTQNIANWDSLNHMNIIFAVEEQLGITFDDEEIMTLTSVEKIAESAQKHKG